MSEKPLVEQIKHYQRDIVKSPHDSKRMLRCIERLTVLPVTITHLQETGVGRSVNELRKCGGEVGAAANALVSKWKNMVVKEEEEVESAPESDVEVNESKDCHSPPYRNDVDKTPRPVNNNDDKKIAVSSQDSNKKVELSRSDSRSSRCSDHKSPRKSEHKSSRSESTKSAYNNGDSKHSSSHKSKTDHDSRTYKKSYSNHKSEPERNDKVTVEKSHSKERTDKIKSSKSSSGVSNADSKSKDIKQKYSNDKHRIEGHSHKKSSSSKKYDLKKVDSDTSDDENIYKPSNKKRKKSESEEEQKYSNNKYSKKSFDTKFHKKRKYDSSEESVDESDSGEEDKHVNGESMESGSDNNSESELSNRSAEDNLSDNGTNADNRSSSQESDNDRSQSARNSDSDESSNELSETEAYVPVKIKRENESPPKHKSSSDSDRKKSSSRSSSSNFKHHSSSGSTVIKKEKEYDDVKIKKEKVHKDNVKPQKEKEEKTLSDKKSHKSSSSHSRSSSKYNDKTDNKVKIKIEKKEDGSIDCESGASFGDALLGLSETKKKPVKRKPTTPSQEKSPKPSEKNVSKPKVSSKLEPQPSSSSSYSLSKLSTKEPVLLSKNIKLEPLDVDLKATLPEITPNYKPLPHYSPPSSPANKKTKYLTEEEALNTMMSNKNQRTKVYSGNKTGYTKVPSLFDLCIQVLRDNIEALEYTGGVPYDLLKPVLDRATADQLYQLEHYNPYLIGDTDNLWKFHCNKDFRGKKPDEYETWRELYLRLLDERERKLEALKANISKSMAKSTPVRQTKLAYVDSVVKPPRNVARKQMKFGTQKAVKHDLVSKAMVGAAGATTSASVPDVVPVPSPVPSRSSSAFPIPNFIKKKKAPLMAKALQLIKGNRFKR